MKARKMQYEDGLDTEENTRKRRKKKKSVKKNNNNKPDTTKHISSMTFLYSKMLRDFLRFPCEKSQFSFLAFPSNHFVW